MGIPKNTLQAANSMVVSPRTAYADDELIFSVDGLPQKGSLPATSVLQWPVNLPATADLSPVARQVLNTAQNVLMLLDSDLPNEQLLSSLAVQLAYQLPKVRFFLRSSAPKRPSIPERDPSWALRSLRHTVLVAVTEDEEELLIEPAFRSHFSLPGSSAPYATALSQLPDLLVLHPAAMRTLVSQQGARLAAETEITGRSLAPWRTVPALLSKWLPANFTDVPVVAASPPLTVAPVTPSTLRLHRDSDNSSYISSGYNSPRGVSPTSVLPVPPPSMAKFPSGVVDMPVPWRTTQQAITRPAPGFLSKSLSMSSNVTEPKLVVVGFAVSAPSSTPVVPATTAFARSLSAPVSTQMEIVSAPTVPDRIEPVLATAAITPVAVQKVQVDVAEPVTASLSFKVLAPTPRFDSATPMLTFQKHTSAEKQHKPTSSMSTFASFKVKKPLVLPLSLLSSAAVLAAMSKNHHKQLPAGFLLSKVHGGAVSKVSGGGGSRSKSPMLRAAEAKGVYELLPAVHTVRMAGEPVDWAVYQASSLPRVLSPRVIAAG